MIGIIGGTGVYDPELLEDAKQIKVFTPYGPPSDLITTGFIKNKEIAFIPRHGYNHTIPPHRINNKANIWAFKELGADRILAICATGSLKEDYKPCEIVIPDQFIDFGKNVETFYDGGKVCHVSMADPFCPELREILINIIKKLKIPLHDKGTYLRISGPQFSTRAASRMYKMFADLIGMTGVAEAILSRELGICFSIISTITDYDVWSNKPVSADEIKAVMSKNLENVRKIVESVIVQIPEQRSCCCKYSLKGAEV